MGETYMTSDLTEILFLMCHERRILRAERDGQRVTFVFDDSDGTCKELMRQYVLGHDQVSASRILAERQKALRLISMT